MYNSHPQNIAFRDMTALYSTLKLFLLFADRELILIYRKFYRTDLTVCAAFVSRKTARTAGGHDFSFSLGKNFELFFKPRQIVSWLDGKLLLGKVMRGQKCCNTAEQFVAIPGISDDLFLY